MRGEPFNLPYAFFRVEGLSPHPIPGVPGRGNKTCNVGLARKICHTLSRHTFWFLPIFQADSRSVFGFFYIHILLFPDTEPAKNAIEKIIRVNRTDHLSEMIECQP